MIIDDETTEGINMFFENKKDALKKLDYIRKKIEVLEFELEELKESCTTYEDLKPVTSKIKEIEKEAHYKIKLQEWLDKNNTEYSSKIEKLDSEIHEILSLISKIRSDYMGYKDKKMFVHFGDRLSYNYGFQPDSRMIIDYLEAEIESIEMRIKRLQERL